MSDRMVFTAYCRCGCGGIVGGYVDDRPDCAEIVDWIRSGLVIHYVTGPVRMSGCLREKVSLLPAAAPNAADAE